MRLPFSSVTTAYGHRWLFCHGTPDLLFTDNETNTERLYGYDNGTATSKDGINDFVVHGKRDAVNRCAQRHESGRALSR